MIKYYYRIIEGIERVLLLTDDKSKAEEWLTQSNNGPLIFYEHDGIVFDKKADWIIQNLEAIEDNFVEKVFQRYYGYPWVIAETDRIFLKEISLSDNKRLPKELQWDPDFLKSYISTMYEIWGFGLWHIYEKNIDAIVGRAGIGITDNSELELSYEVFPEYCNNGYGYESSLAVLEYIYNNLEINEIICRIKEGNIPSIRLCDKLIDYYHDKNQIKIIKQIIK